MRLNLLGTHLYNHIKEKKFLLIYFPLTLYWIVLFIATSLPGEYLPFLVLKLSDKIEHLVAYFILAILFNLMLHFQTKVEKLSKNSSLSTIFILLFYAVIDELHQIFIPNRYYDILDLLADFIGIILGVTVVFLFIKNYELNKNE
ncbi:VanZ family protein [Melioribacteraceae bacterium 4301-Me]|uniref:VanZ family protein n=1 Tax=Pyranulibacter aquaticus TaxID=3163344 RepID=UPI00359860EC